MAKIYPNPCKNSCDDSSSGRETFTIWMKSLVCHGNGCTVFNSRGEVVFRVDNYQQRCSRQVFLMDSIGTLLFSLNRRNKFGIFGSWEGFKWMDSEVRMESACFKVRRNHKILSNVLNYQVTLGCDEDHTSYYNIMGLKGKSAFKITNFSGQILAEARPKKSSEGIALGDDVLTLMVEANVNQSLIMALATVYGLINNRI